MTLVEFLHRFKGYPVKFICLSALYYSKIYHNKEGLSVKEIRNLLKEGKVPNSTKHNISDSMAKNIPLVAPGKRDKINIWKITKTGEDEIQKILSAKKNDITTSQDIDVLEKLYKTIKDTNVIDYVSEAITCMKVKAYRAAVVFLWAGAIQVIRKEIMSFALSDINKSIVSHDPKARNIKKEDDLEYIKEMALLVTAQDLGIFDKNQKEMLEMCLKLRNACGHPNKYKPGEKKVSSFIEDLIQIVFNTLTVK